MPTEIMLAVEIHLKGHCQPAALVACLVDLFGVYRDQLEENPLHPPQLLNLLLYPAAPAVEYDGPVEIVKKVNLPSLAPEVFSLRIADAREKHIR